MLRSGDCELLHGIENWPECPRSGAFIIQGGAIEVDEVPISLYHEKKRQAQDDRTGQRYKKDGEAGCQ